MISFRPPTVVQLGVAARGFHWHVHHIEDAKGENINLDYYPVVVSQLPTTVASPEDLLTFIRQNLNTVVDTNVSEFSPYDALVDTPLWLSGNPLGAVIHIDMNTLWGYFNPDDGSVVTAETAPDHWIFSTIWTLGDLSHPVSGNRQFGFTRQGDGSFVFYTRGADRATGRIDKALAEKVVFAKAHELWLSLQQGIANYVNSNGGAALVNPPTSCRYDWGAVSAQYHQPTVSWIP